jgi:ketosteroid isomerase-like protein
MTDLMESVKEMYAAFGRGDRRAILEKLDPSVQWEFEAPPELSFAGTHSGPKGASDFFDGIDKDHKDPELEMTEFVISGDAVAAFGRYKATVKATGQRVDSPVAHLFKFRAGKVVRYVNFLNTAAFVATAAARAVPAEAATRAALTADSRLVKFYGHWAPVALVHGLMLVLLVVGTFEHTTWPLYVAIGLFTVWDLAWVGCSPPDRTAQEILETSARARTYTSYFVAVYGAGLAYFLLRMGSQEQTQVFAIVKNAGVPMALLLSPLALPAVAMLFFPIRVGRGDGTGLAAKAPTAASIAVLLVNAWVEKVATFCFVYTVAMIGTFLAANPGQLPTVPPLEKLPEVPGVHNAELAPPVPPPVTSPTVAPR